MKFFEAQAELKRILKEQQTVSIPKLKRLLQSMNVSVNGKQPKEAEVEYLKGEIKKLKG